MAQHSGGSPTALAPRCPGCGWVMRVERLDLNEEHPVDEIDEVLVALLSVHDADELLVDLEHCDCGRARIAVQHLIRL